MNIGFDAKRAFSNNTGLGNYSRDLIRIMSEKFPKINFYLFKPKKTKNNYFETLKTNQFILEPHSKFYKIFNGIWRMFGLIPAINKNEIAIYHGLSAEIPIGNLGNIKTVVTIHDLIFMTHPHLYHFFDRQIYFWKSKYAMQNADKIIAISHQTKADCIKYLDADPSKIEVIHQGCNNIFKYQFADYELVNLIKNLNLPQNFILNVGTIEERKNVLSIIKAIKNIDTHLVMVGKKKKYYKVVKKYIDENKLNNKVTFLENVSLNTLAKLYQAAQIFVYPSLYEGFGIPIIEALYSKTPVITTNGGCFEEAGGPNSIYIEPLNIGMLEQKIKLLISDTNLRQTIAKAGFEYAQKFNDENIQAKLISIYEKLMTTKNIKSGDLVET